MALASKTSKPISSEGTTDIVATDFNPLEIIDVVFYRLNSSLTRCGEPMALASKTSKPISSEGTTDIVATDFNPLEIIDIVFYRLKSSLRIWG
jgi:hypothetical protein